MTLEAALAATATLVALAFALSTLERWFADRRGHQLAWTISIFLFAAGSAALWVGTAVGWEAWTFRLFYLFGAVLNVPFLAAGTVYLLAGKAAGDRTLAVLALAATFCAGWVLGAPMEPIADTTVLPAGSDVFGPVPRIMAAVGSGVASIVLFGGAGFSATRLVVRRRRGLEGPAPGGPSAARLAAANGLIALGTLILAAGGLSNSVLGEMGTFAVTLALGIAVIFAGFLLTNGPGRQADLPAWIDEALAQPGAPPRDVHRANALETLAGPRQN